MDGLIIIVSLLAIRLGAIDDLLMLWNTKIG